MKILVLGTSAELPFPRIELGTLSRDPISRSRDSKDKRLRSSIAIEFPTAPNEYMVIDPTPDFWEQVQKNGIADKVKAIFITHTHKDKVEGLFVKYTPILTFALKSHWEKLEDCLVPLDRRKVLNKNLVNLHGLRIFPFPVFHGSESDIVCGYKIIDNTGSSIVYLPEVKSIPRVSRKFIYNLDTLILDGRNYDYETDWHTSIRKQLEWAKEYKPKKLYFTYIGKETAPHRELVKIIREGYANSDVMYDGQMIVINSKDTAMDLKDFVKIDDFSSADDQTLLFHHYLMHSLNKKIENNEIIKGWETSSVSQYHEAIVAELTKRGITHQTEDSLDQTTKSDERVFSLKKELEIVDSLRNTEEEDYTSSFVSVTAKSFSDNSKEITVYIKNEERLPLLEHTVSKMFSNEEKAKLHFVYSLEDPTESYIPLFDLKVSPRKSLESVFISDTYSEPTKIFGAMIPELATDDISEITKWAIDKLSTGVATSPVMDGLRVIASASIDDGVHLYVNKDSKDIADTVPHIKEQLSHMLSVDLKEFILDGVIATLDKGVAFKADEPIPTNVDGIANTEGQPRTKLYVHDCLSYGLRDITQEPLKKRLEYLVLATRTSEEDIIVVKNTLCSTQEQLVEAISTAYQSLGLAGVLCREITSKYAVSGVSEMWCFHTYKNPKALDIDTAGRVLVQNRKDPKVQDETINKPIR